MNFFGYKLGESYPPPLDNPDYYTNNLEPCSKSQLNKDIKINLFTSGTPDFLISSINAEMKTLYKNNIQQLYSILIDELKKEDFNIDPAINIGACIQQSFNKNQYHGKIFYEHNPNIDREYCLSFVINDTTLPSKGLFS